jgi:hypothetical protein
LDNTILHIDNTTQQLIPLSQPEKWKAALEGIEHAFGHTWESCYAMHLTTKQSTFLYLFESEGAKVVCPISEREFKGFTDIVTPYGFSGFAGNKEVPGFEKYWKRFVKEKGYVCGYIGLNPILKHGGYVDPTETTSYNTLFVLNLQLSIEQLFAKLSSNRKRQLKDFKENTAFFTTDKGILKQFFLSQYHNFFSRKEASAVYNFSMDTLSFLADLDNVLMVGRFMDNQLQAISVFAYTPYMADYLFSISLPECQHHAAPLIWYAVDYLKSKQIPLLNLGGGVKAGDSIAQFKQRFGPDLYPLQAAKQIYDYPNYQMLCLQVREECNEKEGYFPAYRKPKQIL